MLASVTQYISHSLKQMDPFNTGIHSLIHPPSCRVQGPGCCCTLDHSLCWRDGCRVKTMLLFSSVLPCTSYSMVLIWKWFLPHWLAFQIKLSEFYAPLPEMPHAEAGGTRQVRLSNLNRFISFSDNQPFQPRKSSLLTTSLKRLAAKGDGAQNLFVQRNAKV